MTLLRGIAMDRSTEFGKRSSAKVNAVSRNVSTRILEELSRQHLQKGLPIPLEELAGRFGITIKERSDEPAELFSDFHQLGLEGMVRRSRPVEDAGTFEWSKPEYEIYVLSQGIRARFTAAHEIAHVVLASQFREIDNSLSNAERESICDKVARQLLLPAELVKEHFQPMVASGLDIAEIERISGRMKVSLSVLINRLSELVFEGAIVPSGIVLLAKLERSRKRHDNLAPRVASSCGPSRWFVPINARLSSIGLCGLQAAFYEAPLYEIGRLSEELRTWDYVAGRRSLARCGVAFKCYRWSDTRSSAEQGRVMLAALDLE
jgi:hypothetical protein